MTQEAFTGTDVAVELEQWRGKVIGAAPSVWGDFERNLAAVARFRDEGIEWTATNEGNRAIAALYYDFPLALITVGDLTGDDLWYERARTAADFLWSDYLDRGRRRAPAWLNYTNGVRELWARTGESIWRDAVQGMATGGGYSRPPREIREMARIDSAHGSREVANAIRGYVDLSRIRPLSSQEEGWLRELVNKALSHIDQWTGRAPFQDFRDDDGIHYRRYVYPFMVSLTMGSLLHYHNELGRSDSRILPALDRAADFLIDPGSELWIETQSTMRFSTVDIPNRADRSPAPDLNLLIAPRLMQLAHHSGRGDYERIGRLLISGGIANANFIGDGTAKHFNQQVQAVAEWLRWRETGHF